MRNNMVERLSAVAVFFVLLTTVNIAVGQSDSATTNQNGNDKITIVDSTGKPAEKATVFSVSKNMNRRQLLNPATQPGGKFSPLLFDGKGALPKDAMNGQLVPGVLTADTNGVVDRPDDAVAFLVVSQDEKEVAFVPPGYEGTVRLRPCGILKCDTSELKDAGEPYFVVIVWKNCLAGRYALVGNKQPGDPEGDVSLDWRLRAYFEVTTYLTIDPKINKTFEIYLPPGEASVAVITDKQNKLLAEFGAEFGKNPQQSLTYLPATSGIHRIFQSKTTTVPLRIGTCFQGKLANDTVATPDWQDSGFADATISISDNWASRLDRIPEYDLSQGVNHYFKILQSEIGLKVRARTLAQTQVFLKSDGTFVTWPLPEGEYRGILYRPNQTIEMPGFEVPVNSPNKGPINSPFSSQIATAKTRTVQVGAFLRSEADLPNPIAEINGHLWAARKAVWGGDLETASKNLDSAKKLLASATEFKVSAASIPACIAEIEQMIERHSRLIEMANDNDQNYNLQAASFLLSQAEGFLKQSNFFYAEQVVAHARRFARDTNRHDELQARIDTARTKSLFDPKPPVKYQSPFRVNDQLPEVVDVGKLIFDVPKSTDYPGNSTDYFHPLQKLPITDPAVFRRLQSLVFRERNAAERLLKYDPQEAVKQMVQTRRIIRESNVPHNSQTPLLEVIDRDIKTMQDYSQKNLAENDRNSSPSQQLLQQIKAMNDHDSLEFDSAVAQLSSTISEQFDEKLRTRNAELGLLEEKINKARQSLEQRKINRSEIIQRRLRKLLLDGGIEPRKLPEGAPFTRAKSSSN